MDLCGDLTHDEAAGASFELTDRARARAGAAQKQHGAWRLWSVYAFTMMDLLSHNVIMLLAWFTTAYVIPVYLAIHLAMAVRRLGFHKAVRAPLLWLMPECSSLRGDPCSVASVVSVLLRLAVLIFWFCAVSFPVESLRRSICFHFDDPGYYSGAECQNLPAWLRTPWWSDNATCVARASRYERCFDEVPWYLQGQCNSRAGGCARTARFFVFSDAAGFLSICVRCSSLLALALVLLEWGFYCLCACCPGTSYEPLPDHSLEAVPRPDPGLWRRLMLVKLIGLFMLDVVSDVNGIVQFVLTGNFKFAAISSLVFIYSAGQQIASGGIQKFLRALGPSLAACQPTDELQALMLSEMTVEAPLQFMLQFYTFTYVLSSNWATYSFVFSLLLSLLSVTDAAYQLIQLELIQVQALHLAEVESSRGGHTAITRVP